MTRPNAIIAQLKNHDGSGSNVIINLPPGPLFQGLGTQPTQEDLKPAVNCRVNSGLGSSSAEVAHCLASMTSATVVTINYRLGIADGVASFRSTEAGSKPDSYSASVEAEVVHPKSDTQANFYQYPTPVHDTLAGFDWIQRHLRPAQLGVFGSHIGGSLALMLALTEAQTIRAVAALEPVCDWPGLDEYCAFEESTSSDGATKQKQRRPAKKKASAPPDLVPLLEARERFFATPERCFDAFASPILFLRSAGRDVPKNFPQYLTGPDYPVPVHKTIRKVASNEQDLALTGSPRDRDNYPNVDEDNVDYDPSEMSTPTRRRKALSRWPPYGLDYGLSGHSWNDPGQGIGRLQVTLPWVRVFVQEKSAGLASHAELSSPVSTNKRETTSKPTVLSQQAEEMVSVMRRACFWGREKGYGERRVTLSRVDGELGPELKSWFGQAFDESKDDE